MPFCGKEGGLAIASVKVVCLIRKGGVLIVKEYRLFASTLDNPAEVSKSHWGNIAFDGMFSSPSVIIEAESAGEAIELFAENCIYREWSAAKQKCWFYGIDDAGIVRFAAEL